MPANSSSLSVTNLDFKGIKNSLINSLRSQHQFKDYDFDGPNLAVLIELLARNSSLSAFLTNMLFSEAFLDSAQLTTSVFSRAKELNYTPRSGRSARATIGVNFQATGENQPYVIPKGSSFNTLIKNQSFVFSLPETIIVSSPNTSFSFVADIYEGIYLKDTYIYETTLDAPFPRFKITNKSIDTTSLSVVVFEDGKTVGDTYNLATSLLGLDDQSKVFFIQSGDDGFFEVQFGDGVVGRKPKDNSAVVLDYRVCSFDKANGATLFSINFDPTGINKELASGTASNPGVTTFTNAIGGSQAEDIESVRYYAPRWYQTQERAVTAQDYAILLKTAFPEINAVAVYGGEDESPPQFGKVIVSVDISNIDGVPPSKEQQYYDYLKRRCPLSIDPIFKDPQFTYVHIDTIVRYNVNVAPASQNRIQTLVMNTINQFNLDKLNNFNVTLRYSKLVEAIDDTDDSIISNLTDISLYKKLQPDLITPQQFVLQYGTPLNQEGPTSDANDRNRTLTSSQFTYKGDLVTLQDGGDGTVQIVKKVGNDLVTLQQVGTIDYAGGSVTISGLVFDNYTGDYFKIYVIPADRDVTALQRNILTIEPDEVDITVEALRL
jgi:hypothetical protein